MFFPYPYKNPWRTAKMNVLKKWWCDFLKVYLPTRIKRMIFLASVFAYISETDTPSDETVQKLNEVMRLSRDEQAIRLPIAMKKMVWKTLDEPLFIDDELEPINDLREVVKNCDSNIFAKIVHMLIKRAPDWTVYASESTIQTDLRIMFDKMFTHG